MKTINRDKIQRMVSDRIGGGGGGDGSDITGVATQAWVENNYIAIKFFNEIFVVKGKKTTTVGSGTPVVNNNYIFEPNEVPGTKTTTEGGVTTTVVTEIMNIQVKAGLWTQKFLSALGQGSGGSGSSGTLHNLDDVDIDDSTLHSGQILVYRNTHWVNENMPSPGGSGTVTSVGLSVPTGLLVSGASSKTITNAGTFAITFATGYSLLEASDKTAWDDLIGYFDDNGNALHALVADALNVDAACNVWGQEYMGANGKPKSVTGKMSNVGDIVLDYDTDHLGLYRKVVFRDSSGGYLDYVGHRYNSNNGEHSIVVAVGGTEYFAFTSSKFYTTVGILSESYVTALSDIRFKEVIDRFTLNIEQIAAASLIHFTWKDRENDHSVHAGGIAQEWQKILPEAVVETEDGKLAMDYGVIGVASAISLARKVKAQQQEIDELKKQNAEMEKLLARLEKLMEKGGLI